MDLNPQSLSGYWRLIRENRNFRKLWLAQIVSEIGDWFYALSIYSLLLELTGNAGAVGAAVVLQVLPNTFIGPTAGVINDRMSRKRVMIAADVVRMVVVLGMLLVRTREMVWLVYPLLLLETLMWGLFEPAHHAVIPNVTGEQDVLMANTLASTTWSFNLAIGSTLGGAVAALFGRDAVFLLNAASFLISALLIRGMRFDEPHMADLPPLRARDLVDFSPILEGIRYVRGKPRLLATVFVKGGLGFGGSNLVILPLLGEHVFHIGVSGIDRQRAAILGMSVLMGSRGVGALLGPFVSGAWAGGRESRMRLGIFFGFLVWAVGYMILGVAPALWLACAAVVVSHAGGSTIWVFSTTLLQMYTEDKFRGRVFAADLGICTLAISIAGYLAGRAIDHGIPPRTYAIITGFSLLIPAFAWMLALRWSERPRP